MGYAQVKAGTSREWTHARRLGLATATTLLVIDVVYVPRGRLKWTYLIDAAGEAILLLRWASATRNYRKQTH